MAGVLEAFVEEQLAQLGAQDVEPKSLVPYVMALLKKQVDTRDAHLDYCVEELQDFLSADSRPVVERVFTYIDGNAEAQSVLQQPYMPKRMRDDPDVGGDRKRHAAGTDAPVPVARSPAGRFGRGGSEGAERREGTPETALHRAAGAPSLPASADASVLGGAGAAGGLSGLDSLLSGIDIGQLSTALSLAQARPVAATPQAAPSLQGLAGLAGLLQQPQQQPQSQQSGLSNPLLSQLAMSLLGNQGQARTGLTGLPGLADPATAALPGFGGADGLPAVQSQAELTQVVGLRDRSRARTREAQLRRLQCILVACKVPPHLNHDKAMRQHFETFGTISTVLCNPQTGKAYVVFEENKSCRAARDSPNAVLGNRFIALYQCSEKDLADLTRCPLPASTRAAASPADKEKSQQQQKELVGLRAQLAQKAKAAAAKTEKDIQLKQEHLVVLRQEASTLQSQMSQPGLAVRTKEAIDDKFQAATDRVREAEAELRALTAKLDKYRDAQTAPAPPKPKLQGRPGAAWWGGKGANSLDVRPKTVRVVGLSDDLLKSRQLRQEFTVFGDVVDISVAGGGAEVTFRDRWHAERCFNKLRERTKSDGTAVLTLEWVTKKAA
eukprot:TRINITY_DN441_c3_g1_i1.p1 TRINITY_DN441_c3_g1~~TRINITY_DN441_c3_g1_i1.p1  ORF type:complete len:630 (+),score=185.70 TRINITY_DN441_c3_g1_i1:61-1890(+)